MVKKILALISAMALLVCAVSVFTVATTSAEAEALTFDEKVAAEAEHNKALVSDFKTNSTTWESTFTNNNYTGRGMRITEAGGVPHIQVNAHWQTVFSYYYTKAVSVEGTHIVLDNVATRIDGTGDYGSFSLVFYNTTNLTPEAIVRFREDGAVYLRRGAQTATGSAAFDKVWMAAGDTVANQVVKGFFAEDAASILSLSRDASGNIVITVTNAAGSADLPAVTEFTTYGINTETMRIGLGNGYVGNSSITYEVEFDVLAIHDGSKTCAIETKQAFINNSTAEIEKHPVAVDDFIPSQGKTTSHLKPVGTTGVTGFWQQANADGSVHYYVGGHSTANFDYRIAGPVQVDGAHILMGNLTFGEGSVERVAISFSHPDAGTTYKWEGLVRFYPDGKVEIRPKSTGSDGWETVHAAGGEGTAVVSAIFAEDAKTLFSMALDDSGAIVVTVTNEAGTFEAATLAKFSTMTDVSSMCIGVGDGYVSTTTHNMQFDIYAFHGGESKCGFAEEADPAETVDALIDAIGTVTADSKEALYAAINGYNALSKADKARVTKLDVLCAAEAAWRRLAVSTPGAFDESDIVATFGVMSDIHLQQGNAVSVKEFQTAIDVTNRLIGENKTLDALLMTGDYTYTGAKADAEMFLNQLLDNYDTDKTALVIAYGNHDTYWTGCMDAAGWYDVLKDAFTFQAADSRPEEGNHHVVVGGIHFITVQPTSYSPNAYPAATKTWLDSVLASIVAENPNAPIFVGTHGPSLDTIYGSDTKLENTIANWGSTTQLDAILNKYPQVIMFSGHTHFGIGVDRAIMQKGYTTVQAGAVTGLDIEGDFANASAASLADASQGWIVEVDGNGATRLTRVDYKNGCVIGEPWIVRTPDARGSHLVDYTSERGTTLGPVIDANSITVRPVGNSGAEVSFAYPSSSATVYSYNIVLKKNGTILSELNTLSEWWANSSDITTETFRFSGLTDGFPYEVSITATDEWGNVGPTVTVTAEDTDAIAAALADEVEVLISAIGTVSVDSKATIQTARRAYNELNTRARAMVENYATLTAAEDAYKALFGSDALFTADGVEKTTYTGVSYENGENGLKVTYTNTGYGPALALKGAHKLDGAHIVLDNINITSGYGLGITLSGNEDAPGDYVSGGNVILLFEFNNGRIREYPGSGGAVILTSDLLLAENVQSGLEIRFTEENGTWYLGIKTDMGEATAVISATAMNATSLADKNAVYFALASRSNGFNATMDLVSFHGGETACKTDKLLSDMDDAAEADKVDVLINAIGTVTLDSKPAIDAARAAYDGLTDAQKALVAAYDTLTAAEAAYASLVEAADMAAAAAVDEKINAIGTVTLTDEAAINAARAAYDGLTEAQKAKVTLYATLTAAEAAYTDLLIAMDGPYTPDSSVIINPGHWGSLTTTATDKGVNVDFNNSGSIDIRTYGGKAFALDGLHIILNNFTGQGFGISFVNGGAAEAYNHDGLRITNAADGTVYLLNAKWDNAYKTKTAFAPLTSTVEIRVNKLDNGDWQYTVNGNSMVIEGAFVESVITDPDAVYVQFFQHPWLAPAFTTSSFDVVSMHGGKDACGLIEKEQIIAGEQLKEDLSAAVSGDTVTLTGDAAIDTAIVKPGVTLDLGGYDLKADYFVAFGNVVNNGNNAAAALKVPKDCIMLPKNNASLPVWNGEGYVFVAAPTFQHQYKVSGNAISYTFLPTFDASVHELLAAGAEESNVSVTVRLTWTPRTGGTAVQDFVFSDVFVRDVINSYADGRYGKAYTLTFNNAAKLSNLQYSVAVTSGTGVSFAPSAAAPQA